MVVDMNGTEIKPGDVVLIHHEDLDRIGTVVKVFPELSTVNQPGHWVDVDAGLGHEGIPSYILEVQP